MADRNLRERPDARMQIRGEETRVRATTPAGGDEHVREAIRDFLLRVPRDARHPSVHLGPGGQPNEDDVAAAALPSVLIELELEA